MFPVICRASAILDKRENASIALTTKEGDKPFEQCTTFKRVFDKKLQDREIIFQNEGASNVHERTFPNHNNNRGKEQVRMVSLSRKGIEENVPMYPKGKPKLEKMAQRVQNLSSSTSMTI